MRNDKWESTSSAPVIHITGSKKWGVRLAVPTWSIFRRRTNDIARTHVGKRQVEICIKSNQWRVSREKYVNCLLFGVSFCQVYPQNAYYWRCRFVLTKITGWMLTQNPIIVHLKFVILRSNITNGIIIIIIIIIISSNSNFLVNYSLTQWWTLTIDTSLKPAPRSLVQVYAFII